MLHEIHTAVPAERAYNIVGVNLFSDSTPKYQNQCTFPTDPLTRASLLPPRPREPGTPRPHSSGRRRSCLMPSLTIIRPSGDRGGRGLQQQQARSLEEAQVVAKRMPRRPRPGGLKTKVNYRFNSLLFLIPRRLCAKAHKNASVYAEARNPACEACEPTQLAPAYVNTYATPVLPLLHDTAQVPPCVNRTPTSAGEAQRPLRWRHR